MSTVILPIPATRERSPWMDRFRHDMETVPNDQIRYQLLHEGLESQVLVVEAATITYVLYATPTSDNSVIDYWLTILHGSWRLEKLDGSGP